MHIIDLSLTMEPTKAEPVPTEIAYVSHAEGADILGRPAGIDRSHFPDGMALSLEYVKLTSHSGTHVDAPSHYGPTCAGERARSIEELPLDWFFRDGVVLGCVGDVNDGPVTRAEIEAELARIDYRIKPFDIVLIRTGADRHWPTERYFTDFRGVTAEATAYLVEAGVKVIGIDSFGFDPPFGRMLDEYRRTGRMDALWPAHFYGRKREYCQIERLAYLDRLPRPHGFRVACFPIKIKDAGAGWSRVAAIFG
jgi:kynurenine formamidase